ncbi:alpha/beta fold hydrolase [Paenibacillus sp. J22TS3]|uniref:alpha/beta fold hydrolase n=1 Tax=Paenibacillus sp. J22TS3 TaxID=2807192 RepID=UPI001B214BB7|nr:alpha/beta fold hydrolase [Paenibacillus sp. J22TS3]GIP24218.1 MxaA domain-containing protein [Paenibacillus sp. J22TS3]
MAAIFITGGTGFIGKHILRNLAQQGHELRVLVRSQERFNEVLRQLGIAPSPAERIHPVVGDLALPDLGLEAARWQELVRETEVLIHAGGPMDIQLGEQAARDVFLQGTREVLNLAREAHAHHGLHQFIHIVGFKSPIHGNSLDNPDETRRELAKEPPYEQMKMLADLEVRLEAREAGFPLSVVHPSVVIGDSVTGSTEQTGGLGILVHSVSRGLLRLVPGNARHWLPLVHVDHLGAFVAALAAEKDISAAEKTYYLLDNRQSSPSIKGLVGQISKELLAPRPIGSLPLPLLHKLLGGRGGLGKKLGIPPESLSFIVDLDYPADPVNVICERHDLTTSVNFSILPNTIADLDFRLAHTSEGQYTNKAAGYRRGRRGSLATLEKTGSGDPVLFLHGTFSTADCLIPLAEHWDCVPVWLADLPGFGRSPYHHQDDVINGYVDAVTQAIMSQAAPVTLVGHSLGGLIAAKVLERIPERLNAVYLLQPALHPAGRLLQYPALTRAMLGTLTGKRLSRQLISRTCFESEDQIPEGYISHILDELRSTRVRAVTAKVMASLTEAKTFDLHPEAWPKDKVSIIWGDKDRIYHLPDRFRRLKAHTLPLGHHFPLSHPGETAVLMQAPCPGK